MFIGALTDIVTDSLIVKCKSATSPLVMVQFKLPQVSKSSLILLLDCDMIVVMTLPYDNVALVTL